MQAYCYNNRHRLAAAAPVQSARNHETKMVSRKLDDYGGDEASRKLFDGRGDSGDAAD